MTHHPTAYAVVIVVTTLLATSLVQWAFLLGLKGRHRQQWHHAGNPTIWSDQSFISAWATISYLQSRAYRSSGNQAGIRYCNRFRMPMMIAYWTSILIFSAGVLISLMYGWPPAWQ